MIIENNGLKALKSDLAHLDEVTTQLGFVRWQWEYYRATYDFKHEEGNEAYYLRVNARAIEGKLESPHAVLVVEDVYAGRASFPHGLDYESSIPEPVMKVFTQKLSQLNQQLT